MSAYQPIENAPQDTYILVRCGVDRLPGVAKFSTRRQCWIESWMEAIDEPDTFVDDYAAEVARDADFRPTEWQHLPA
jgi:hypothetical protein